MTGQHTRIDYLRNATELGAWLERLDTKRQLAAVAGKRTDIYEKLIAAFTALLLSAQQCEADRVDREKMEREIEEFERRFDLPTRRR
jgi:hypothetical protein